ncbi:unnamed protein product [Paramecium sonneborni]|uniref:Transmembrane protein n=1 Tax=Paramecium sonneborni TaxID=65129 RepID=A0A8S1MFC8_9CILI|nr:unnamed protein product [Paramecium sonneborni]
MLQTLFIVVLLFLLLTFVGIYLRKYLRNKPLKFQNQVQGEIFSDFPISFSNQQGNPDAIEKLNNKENVNMKFSKTTVTLGKNKKSKVNKVQLPELEAAFQFDADNENDNDSMKNSSVTDKQQQLSSKEQEMFNFQHNSHNLEELVTPTQVICQEV